MSDFIPSTPSSTSETTSKPRLKWHTFYCDPIIDIVLKSLDNIYHTASSFVLRRESAFFEGILSVESNDHMVQDKAFALPSSSATTAIFLELSCDRKTVSYTVTQYWETRELHDLMQFLDCVRFSTQVTAEYNRVCSKYPFEWLVDASNANDVDMARTGLRSCGSGGIDHHQ